MAMSDIENSIDMNFAGVLAEIPVEFSKAIGKHGVMRTPANPAMSNGERLKILVEEVGEVARAMTYDEGDAEKLVEELIQVGTMAVASAVGVLLATEAKTMAVDPEALGLL